MKTSSFLLICSAAACAVVLCLAHEVSNANSEALESNIKDILEEHYTSPATKRKKRFVSTLIPIVTKVVGGQLSTGVKGILKGNMGKSITNDLITNIAGKLTDEIINKNHKDDIDKELAEYFKGFDAENDKKAADLKDSIKTVMAELSQKNENMLQSGAKINIVPQKGMQLGDLFTPPGVEINTQYVSNRAEPDSQSGDAYSFSSGVGNALLNGCYGPTLSATDPCYAAKRLLPKCDSMLDAANFIGTGFDGRGDYSSSSRKKSVIQRICNRGGSYDGKSVPDSMTVHGVYDTNVKSMAFSSLSQYQSYLEKKAAVAQSSFMLTEAVTKVSGRGSAGFLGLFGGGGGSSTHRESSSSASSSSSSSVHGVSQQDRFKQLFMSTLEVDVIRYEVFLDDITFNDLNMDFLHDFISLPQSYFQPEAPMTYQNFILRWGTHYVKSAEFGGQLKFVKTKVADKRSSIEQFATKAQSDYQAMFSTYMAKSAQFKSGSIFHSSSGGSETQQSNAGGSAGAAQSETQASQQSAQEQKYSNEVLMVEGGEQGIAAIVSEMYTTGFKHELVQWLDSIPRYPKPFDFTMAPITDLCNINFKQLFPNTSQDFGCFGGETLLTESETDRQYYVWKTEELDTDKGTYTKEHKRYCDFKNSKGLEDALLRRCNSLKTAVSVYLEEGPVPSTDVHLRAGKAGCETNKLAFTDSLADLRKPAWEVMTDGSPFRVVFDMFDDIDGVVGRDESLLVFYRGSTQQWYVKDAEEFTHLYDGFKNGGSNNLNNKKISVRGLVLKYDPITGLMSLDSADFTASKAIIPDLSEKFKGAILARVEFVSMLHQIQLHKNEFGIGTTPCNVEWSNAHRFNPAILGGRCVSFTAVSSGDIFVVFSAIPRDRDTWYYVQVGPEGVAIYKGQRVMKYIDDSSARSLGDSRLFESYFVCVEETLDGSKTTITYGKTPDYRERGHIFAVFEDTDEPLQVRFYAFGNGERELNVMDAHVLRSSSTGEHICVGGTVLFEGKCIEDCHPECIGCHRSGLDTSCRVCKHYHLDNRCVAECPSTHKPNPEKDTCICAYVEDGECVETCTVDRVTIANNKQSGHCACRFYVEGDEDNCLVDCPSTTYASKQSNGQTICKACHSFCVTQPNSIATCSGGAVTQCASCIIDSKNQCVKCDAGKYVVKKSGTSTCLSCENGYKCPGDGRRYQCNAQANERSNPQRTDCISCPSGQYSTRPVSHVCHSCKHGWTRTPSQSHCQRCPTSLAGPNCRLTCECRNGDCMQATGQCKCNRGFSGKDCSVPSDGAIRLVDDRVSNLYIKTVAEPGLKDVPQALKVNKELADIVKQDFLIAAVKKLPSIKLASVPRQGPPKIKGPPKIISKPVPKLPVPVPKPVPKLPVPVPKPVPKLPVFPKFPKLPVAKLPVAKLPVAKLPVAAIKKTFAVPKIATTFKKTLGRKKRAALTQVAAKKILAPTLLTKKIKLPPIFKPLLKPTLLEVSGKIRGRVEIYLNGRWGTVCDRGWTGTNTNIVCRQLGYKNGATKTGAYFGAGSGNILIKHALCRGQETWLKSCPRARWSWLNLCRHKNDVGVVCW